MKTIYLFAMLLLTGACIHDNKSSAIVARTTEKTELAATPEIKYFSAKAAVLPEKYYQQFLVNNQTAQTVSGRSGTLLLIPSEAFSDKNGNIVKGRVKLKMAEGITKTDIVKMGLSTMSDRGPLESGGMIHLAAFSETGDTLQLTKNKAIEIEIPTAKIQPGMEFWEGAISMEGKLTWKNPKPLSNTLRQIPIEAVEVDVNVGSVPAPAAAIVSESSTFSFIAFNGNDTTFWWVFDTVLKTDNSPASEAMLKQLRNGNNVAAWSLTNSGYSWNQLADTTAKFWSNKKFENTVIATAEFRARLPYIREACNANVMTCYTDSPQRELWKSDLAAAEYLSAQNCPLETVFRHFAETRKGKPDAKDPLTVSILDKARTEALNKYRKNTVAALKKANSSSSEAYSFRMTTLGWGNIDRLAFGEKTKRMRLNVNVSGLLPSEKIETALISAKQNCYIPGYQRPNGSFAYTHGEHEPESNLPDEGEAYILVKTKSGKDFRYALQKIRFGEREIETVKLVTGTIAGLEQQIEKLFGKADTEYEDWNTSNIRNGTGCACGQSGVF